MISTLYFVLVVLYISGTTWFVSLDMGNQYQNISQNWNKFQVQIQWGYQLTIRRLQLLSIYTSQISRSSHSLLSVPGWGGSILTELIVTSSASPMHVRLFFPNVGDTYWLWYFKIWLAWCSWKCIFRAPLLFLPKTDQCSMHSAQLQDLAITA